MNIYIIQVYILQEKNSICTKRKNITHELFIAVEAFAIHCSRIPLLLSALALRSCMPNVKFNCDKCTRKIFYYCQLIWFRDNLSQLNLIMSSQHFVHFAQRTDLGPFCKYIVDFIQSQCVLKSQVAIGSGLFSLEPKEQKSVKIKQT